MAPDAYLIRSNRGFRTFHSWDRRSLMFTVGDLGAYSEVRLSYRVLVLRVNLGAKIYVFQEVSSL